MLIVKYYHHCISIAKNTHDLFLSEDFPGFFTEQFKNCKETMNSGEFNTKSCPQLKCTQKTVFPAKLDTTPRV